VARSPGNLERLAAALGELNAYMRVGRITDEEARALPPLVDVEWLRHIESATWRTDAGV
jgi:Ser/Thr protein kinase RdoA (MazF antagonist)